MYLQLNNLTKEFNKKKALDSFNLSIEKGKLLCLLGPSGCGKTTALRIIGGFLRADLGEVIIDGEDITNLSPEERPVATVFQSYALFPHLNVIENVIYGLKFQGYSKKEALKKGEEYLKIVGLLDLKDRKIQNLSGGQQQRVALARALVINPKILLLDEPLSNLDAKLRVKMRNEIKELQKKLNITMIFVTHDQEEALAIADKIAIMENGKLKQIGTPKEIYNNPKNMFTLNFMGASNILKEDEDKVIFCRPEDISLSKECGDIEGKIISSTFMGFYNVYSVKCNGKDYLVNSKNDFNNYYNEGEIIWLTFHNKGFFKK